MTHPAIINTVDIVLLTLKSFEGMGDTRASDAASTRQRLCVALLKRDKEPFAGALALPGGYLHADEDRDTQDAAARTLLAKTGIVSPYLEQLGVWSGPGRDPRGWSLSVVYFALVPEEVISAVAGSEVVLTEVDGLRGLPFDHKDIIDAAVKRVRNKSNYSTLPAHFCGEDFTIARLHEVYEAVVNDSINMKSFRERLNKMDALEEVPGVKRSDGGRPAQVYRLRESYQRSVSVLDRGMRTGASRRNERRG